MANNLVVFDITYVTRDFNFMTFWQTPTPVKRKPAEVAPPELPRDGPDAACDSLNQLPPTSKADPLFKSLTGPKLKKGGNIKEQQLHTVSQIQFYVQPLAQIKT